jgi:hypothetical protein
MAARKTKEREEERFARETMTHDSTRRLVFAVVLGLSVFSCKRIHVPPPAEQVLRLPSGHSFRSLGVVKMHYSNSDAALMFSYVSNAKGSDDKTTVMKEAEEIWPVFQEQVERAGLHFAILSATSAPATSFGFSRGWKYNVVYSQDSGGQWAAMR